MPLTIACRVHDLVFSHVRAHSQNLFVAIGPAAQYGSVVMMIVGRCIYSHNNKSHTVRIEVRASEARHQNTHRVRETRAKTTLPLLEKSVTRKVGASGREKAFTLQGRSHIYYDDVSSDPRPRAHWYMLTHQCCDDAVPSRTPYRAAQSSNHIPNCHNA